MIKYAHKSHKQSMYSTFNVGHLVSGHSQKYKMKQLLLFFKNKLYIQAKYRREEPDTLVKRVSNLSKLLSVHFFGWKVSRCESLQYERLESPRVVKVRNNVADLRLSRGASGPVYVQLRDFLLPAASTLTVLNLQKSGNTNIKHTVWSNFFHSSFRVCIRFYRDAR